MTSLRKLLRQATDAALAGATVVTPHERAARVVRHHCELRMANSGMPWHTPRVLNWSTFLSWLWREAMMMGAVDRVLLGREQQRVLWEQIISQSADGSRLINTPGAATRAREAWGLIHAYGVPWPSTAFERAPETRAFGSWAGALSRKCDQNMWMDSGRAANELTRVADALGAVLPAAVTYGFDDFTPQQIELFQAMRGADVRVQHLTYVAQLKLDGSVEQEHVCQVAAKDEHEEIRRAASWARKHLRQTPSAQIGIVVPRLSETRTTVENILREVLHPESFFFGAETSERLFEVAAPALLSDHGLVDTALRALWLAAGTASLEEACRLVRSPHLLGADEERASRADFDLSLRRRPKPRVTPADLAEEARASKCNALSRQLAAFEKSCAGFAEQHAPGEWSGLMSGALTELGWPGLDLTAEERRAHEQFLDLLRRFSTLAVVRPSQLSAAQAVAEVMRMAREQRFQSNISNAPVQVLSLNDTAGAVFDHLWVCGMMDDAWPPRAGANPFIPASLQLQYGFPRCSPERDNEAAARLLSRLYASAEHVIVSWPKRDKEREFRPAPQVNELPVASRECCEPVAPPVSELLPLVEHELFCDEQAPPVTPGSQVGGTRVFEFQSACPFRAFAQTRLRARPMDEAYAGPNYIDRGKITERTLQLAWDEIGDWKNLNQLIGRAELQTIAEEAAQKAVRECIPQTGLWFDNFRVVECARLAKLALNWFDLERQRSPFVQVEHQKETEITVGGVTVKGYIDRIDHLPTGELVVIDYKSGNGFSVKKWDMPRMDAPQLPLYAVAQEAGKVAAVAFGVVRTNKCDLAGYTRRRELLAKPGGACERDMGQQIGDWRNELEEMASAFLAGNAEVNPKVARKTCKFCHIDALCRVNEQQRAPEIEEAAGDDA
jgi:ATP-dependent helicase/nuclease subunit B